LLSLRYCSLPPALPPHPLPYLYLQSDSLLTAIKFFDDAYYQNSYIARVGGLKVQELNSLEQDFLSYLKFELSADTHIVLAYWSRLRPYCLCTAACGHGT